VEATLVRFVAALRNAGLPVSSDETLVAAQSIKLVGYENRDQLKNTLSMVLAKTQSNKQLFDLCFERFYGNLAMSRENSSQEDQAAASGDAATLELSPSLDQLFNASDDELALAVQQAGTAAGLDSIRLFTQKGVFRRKILEQLEWPALQQVMLDAASAAPGGSPSLSSLQDFAARLQGYAREHVDQQYALLGEARSAIMRDQMLKQMRINRLDPRQKAYCRQLVARISKNLIKHFKRRKRYYRRGVLDLHASLRHNVATDGHLFQLHWRRKHRDRPRLFIICDVSGSVRQYAEVMLLFVASMQELLPKARCYAFSNRLEDISPVLKVRGDAEKAIAATLHRVGRGSTDYAAALEAFAEQAGSVLNRRSVIIMLGDARNNYADPSVRTFQQCAAKAGRTYWLNPEGRFSWNSGDSVMSQFQPYCDAVYEVGTLAQLEHFCEDLLRKTL
jgi:uncharacterized protein with von Willebrand factor type A (vWA) domain